MQSVFIAEFLALMPNATPVEDIEGPCLKVPIGGWNLNRIALIILMKFGSLARTYAVLHERNGDATLKVFFDIELGKEIMAMEDRLDPPPRRRRIYTTAQGNLFA